MRVLIPFIFVVLFIAVLAFNTAIAVGSAADHDQQVVDTPGYDTALSNERHGLYIACKLEDSIFVADYIYEHGTRPDSILTPCRQYQFTALEKERWRKEDSIRRARKKSAKRPVDDARQERLARMMQDSINMADSMIMVLEKHLYDSITWADSAQQANEMKKQKKR